MQIFDKQTIRQAIWTQSFPSRIIITRYIFAENLPPVSSERLFFFSVQCLRLSTSLSLYLFALLLHLFSPAHFSSSFRVYCH